MFCLFEYIPGLVGSPGAHLKLWIFSCNSFTCVMLLILSGHLVHAHIVNSISKAHSGKRYLLSVGSCMILVVMPTGRHSVKYVTGVIVD